MNSIHDPKKETQIESGHLSDYISVDQIYLTSRLHFTDSMRAVIEDISATKS